MRCELLYELFSPNYHEKWVHKPLLNFSVHTKVDQIGNVNALTLYSTTHYLANSSRYTSRLINCRCAWTHRSGRIAYCKSRKKGNRFFHQSLNGALPVSAAGKVPVTNKVIGGNPRHFKHFNTGRARLIRTRLI